MATSETSEPRPPRKAEIPRWAVLALAPLVWLVAIPFAHGVVPWAISLLGRRYGWVQGSPALWNVVGVMPVAAGALVLVWLMVLGFAEAAKLPERVELNWSPKLLVTRGPYAFSRHPMYLSELALWLGWAVLYGSIFVLVALLLLCVVVRTLAANEEVALEAKFGDAYRDYATRVPRWLASARH